MKLWPPAEGAMGVGAGGRSRSAEVGTRSSGPVTPGPNALLCCWGLGIIFVCKRNEEEEEE